MYGRMYTYMRVLCLAAYHLPVALDIQRHECGSENALTNATQLLNG